MIIEKDCDDGKISMVNEVIRGNFKLLYFFYDKFLQVQKAQKDA